MKKLLLFPLSFLVSSAAMASTPIASPRLEAEPQTAPNCQNSAAHCVKMTWQPSTTAGVDHYNVYRAPCPSTALAGNTCSQEGPFGTSPIGAVLATAAQAYEDDTVIAGNGYVYAVTAVCPSTATGCGTVGLTTFEGESPMSNHVAAGIVTTLPPAPPLNLALVAVVMHVNGSAAALSASWTDAPNHGGQTWKVFDYSGHVIATKNVSSDSTGDYSILAAFPTPKKFPVTFQVCDRSTCKDRSVSPN